MKRGIQIPRLMMFITERIPNRIRGELMKWMLQIKPGVFIGTLSKRIGEKLWTKIQNSLRTGGAFWVISTNNEQKFNIHSCGETRWSVQDYDGLHLITHPILKKNSTRDKTQAIIESKNTPKILESLAPVTWDTQNIPKNLIMRTASFWISDFGIKQKLTGNSAYGEYPPEKLWSYPWINELRNFSSSLLKWISKNMGNCKELTEDKVIGCLDLETTDYMPKAREGFINFIGLVILRKKESNPILDFYQAINMTRKKSNVLHLLNLIEPYFNEVNTLLVFNKEFDIQILNHVIREFSSKMSMPSNIIDLKNWYPSLKKLEENLAKAQNIQRIHTCKSDFLKYYSLFKGKGKLGLDKKIEPLGTYNLIDTITPLYAYLLMDRKNN